MKRKKQREDSLKNRLDRDKMRRKWNKKINQKLIRTML